MSDRKFFFKRIGLLIAKSLLGLYIFGAGIAFLAILIAYFFDRSIGFNGEFGQLLRGKEMYIILGSIGTGVVAYFIYGMIPDFEDLLNPSDEDY